jgi:DNA-binding winged helix-turn-helix (wHTH) protein/tetratricopeptide (TPR) repeat protein
MIYRFRGLELDDKLYQVRRAGREVRIRRRTFEVLAYLLQHRDQVVSKSELLEGVWGQTFVSESSLANCISELRTSLSDDSGSPQIIQTVYGRGYRFLASVEEPANGSLELEPLDSNDPAQQKSAETRNASPTERAKESFVGRARELEHLGFALDEALHRRGRVVLLVGEPGIGKTRTAEKFAEHARERGARVAIGRCDEGEGTPPYWPWVQILRACQAECDWETLRSTLGSDAAEIEQLVPEQRNAPSESPFRPAIHSDAARFRLIESVARFLVSLAQETPLVLLLDDLDNADRSSLLLLAFLSRRLRGSKLCIVGTHRAVGRTREQPLAQLLGDLTRESLADSLSMQPLEETDVNRYLELVSPQTLDPDLARRIYQRTEGNPLFVAELARLLLAKRPEPVSRHSRIEERRLLGLPAGLLATIGLRLDHLGPECRRILEIASAIGREFLPTLLHRAAPAKPRTCLDCLQEAIDAGLVSEVPSEDGVHAAGLFRFNHSLIRDAFYEGLALGDRVDIHRRIGAALEAMNLGDRDECAAEIGRHYSQSADPEDLEKAVAYCTRAGTEATRQFAHDKAADHFENALAALRKLGSIEEPRVCDLLLSQAEAFHRSHQYSRAKEALLQAVDRARRIGDVQRLARAALAWGGLDTLGALDHTWIGLLEEALRGVGEADSGIRAALLYSLVVARFPLDPPETSLALNQQALEMCERRGYEQGRSLGLGLRRSFLLGPDQLDESSTFANDTLVPELGSRDRGVELIERTFRLSERLEAGDASELDTEISAIERLAGQPDNHVLLNVRGIAALLQGRFQEAEGILQRLWGDPLNPIPDGACPPSFACPMFALLRDQGRLEVLEGTLRDAVTRSPNFPLWRILLAGLLAETQRPAEAGRHFDAMARQGFASLPRNGLWLGSVIHLSDICVQLADVERAATLHALLEPFAGRVATLAGLVYVGPTCLALGRLEILLGAWPAADHSLRRALELATRLEARPFEARAHASYAAMLLGRRHPGDREQARSELEQARALVDELKIRGAFEESLRRLEDSPRSQSPHLLSSPESPRYVA